MSAWLNRPFRAFLRDLNIRHKLIVSYLLLIVVPLVVLSMLTYNRSSEIVGSKMTDIASQALEQVNTTLGYTFQNAVKSSNIVYANKGIQEILQRDAREDHVNTQIDDYNKLNDYLVGIQMDQSVYRIRLFLKDDTIYTNEHVNFFHVRDIEHSEAYRAAAEQEGQVHWTPPYTFKYGGVNDVQEILSGVRIINNPSAYGETIGVISVDLLLESVTGILDRSTLREFGAIYLLTQRNETIARTGEQVAAIPERVSLTGLLPQTESEWNRTKLDGEKVLVSYRNVPYTGWKVAVVVPFSRLLQSNSELRAYTVMLMLAIALAACLFAVLISGSLVKRIRRLMKTMRSAESGNLTIRIPASGKDEIGELEAKYNYMLARIESLVDEKYRIVKEAKNAELRILQAQINPHFLYNTLELITCKAIKHNAADVTDLVNLLARFYKLSLSNGKDIISIGDELAHIVSYVGIQNQRWDNAIGLAVEVEEQLAEYTILKLVLQPLVENAILHGIMEKPEGTGTVRIVGRLVQQDIVLVVSDDGVGMDPDALDRLLEDRPSGDSRGFGVLNVDRRLKINYGERYGLTYSGALGKGTSVEVRIPAATHGK